MDLRALRRIDLNLLVSLAVLARSQSVTDAAKDMGVTQSAMSHQLKRLRELFGDPLFVTSLRPMLPTPRAEELLEPLQGVLASLASLTAPNVPFDPMTCTRRFVVAAGDLSEFVSGAVATRVLAERAPHVRVAWVRRGASLRRDLEEGRVDVAVLPKGVPGVEALTGDIRQRTISRDGFSVLLRKDHPLGRKKLTLKRYVEMEHLLVSPGGTEFGVVDAMLSKQGLRRRIGAQVASFVAAPFMVADSDLVLTCPSNLARKALEYAALRSLKPPLPLPTIEAIASWHERVHHDAAHRWFRELMPELASL